MALEFTTLDAISRRLRGRLELSKTALGGGTGKLAAQQVDPQLLEQLGEQVEAKLLIALALIYVLPIPLDAATARIILGGIVEKLVVAEIVLTHFQQSQVPQMGGDAGFGSVIRKQAQEELEAIFAGHGIYIPGLMSPPVTTPGSYRQPLVLPGVALKSELIQPDTLTRSYSLVEQRGSSIPDEEEIFFGYPSKRKQCQYTNEALEDPYQSGWKDL
jgi:hypothetical protein